MRVTLGTGPNQIKEFLPTYHQQTIRIASMQKGTEKNSRLELSVLKY